MTRRLPRSASRAEVLSRTLRREREHNKGIGSKYTKARRPVQMIYKEVFGSRTEANSGGGIQETEPQAEREFLKGRAIGVCSSESNGV